MTTKERFNAFFTKTSGCWIWKGSVTKTGGYGQFYLGNSPKRAHRVAWEFAHGAIPNGLCVLHRCDVPKCVNPAHLFLGTKADNVADMLSKGRASGQVLTKDKVIEIRKRYVPHKVTLSALATEFGVKPLAIFQIVHRKSWPNV